MFKGIGKVTSYFMAFTMVSYFAIAASGNGDTANTGAGKPSTTDPVPPKEITRSHGGIAQGDNKPVIIDSTPRGRTENTSNLVKKIIKDDVRKIMNLCVNSGDGRGYREKLVSSETYEKEEEFNGQRGIFTIKKVCYDIGCCYTSSGAECDETSVIKGDSKLDEYGFVGGWARNKCRETKIKFDPIAVTVNIPTRDDLAGLGFKIVFNGKTYSCNDGEDKKACAIRLGLMSEGEDYNFYKDEDGRFILSIAHSGGGSGSGSGSGTSVGGGSMGAVTVTGSSRGDLRVTCQKKERVWYYLWLAKDWVDSEDCGGSVIETREGTERVVGDMDIQIDRSRGSGSVRDGGASSDGGQYSRERRRYIEFNGRMIDCSYGESDKECLVDVVGSTAYYDWLNCADCQHRRRRGRDNSGDSLGKQIAMVAGAILPPLALYGSAKVGADARVDVAAQCRRMQTNAINAHYNYITNNELPSNTNPYVPECNGYDVNSYAGGWMGNGYGSWGSPYGSMGYSADFMSLMAGPHAGLYNTWNTTGLGINPTLGLNIGGGLNGNLLGNLLGLPSGQISLNTGIANPWSYNVNPNAWGNANFAFDPRLNAYSNGIVPWGNNGSAWGNNNWNGHYNNRQWGPNSQWGNNGQWGGSANGSDFWSVQNSFAANNQAFNQGKNFQQQALQNQINRSVGNAGLYSPTYSPMNIGAGVNLNWQFR